MQGILCEVPGKERDQECQGHYDEEWQASDSGRLPGLRHQDVQDWQGIATVKNEVAPTQGGWAPHNVPSPLFRCTEYLYYGWKLRWFSETPTGKIWPTGSGEVHNLLGSQKLPRRLECLPDSRRGPI